MLLVALLAVLSRPVGASPVFLDQNATTTATIEEDQNLNIPALSHFVDSQELLTGAAIRIVAPPEFGTVTVDTASGNITYLSAADDYGSRSFSYQACNSVNNCTDPVNFTVVITAVNDPPVFGIVNLTVLEDEIITLQLPQGLEVVDPEENLTAASFTIVSPPSTGSLSYNYADTNPPPPFGTLEYVPIDSYFTIAGEPETLVIMACDSDAIDQLCVNQTVVIVITAVREGSVSPFVPAVPKFDGEYLCHCVQYVK